MHSPRLQPPSPPQKLQPEPELPSESCWLIRVKCPHICIFFPSITRHGTYLTDSMAQETWCETIH
jgi:hypothetical protein